jgi:hypothetical protein
MRLIIKEKNGKYQALMQNRRFFFFWQSSVLGEYPTMIDCLTDLTTNTYQLIRQRSGGCLPRAERRRLKKAVTKALG